MSDAPYTRRELEEAGATLPTRGYQCPQCGACVPQFAELTEAETARIGRMIHDEPALAGAEVCAITGCPEAWAAIWVQHNGARLQLYQKVSPCNSPSRAARKGYDLDAILAKDLPNAVSDLCDALQLTTDPLNETEANLLTAYDCWYGVGCEGFNGWLFNNAQVVPVTNARDAFRTIGATRCAEALQAVLDSAAGPDGEPNDDALAELANDPANETAIDSLGETFDKDDIESLLYSYAKSHLDDLK
jgi:hypothetical protein